jgi:hypothetical protein
MQSRNCCMQANECIYATIFLMLAELFVHLPESKLAK